MGEISTLFFPDATTKSLVAVCYLLIVLTSFKRFGRLAVVYETFDAPEKARPWTTFLRFYSACAIYISVYIIAFAMLYRLFRTYPEFIKLAQGIFASDPIAGAILPQIEHIPLYAYPILSVLALTVGISRLKPVAAVEQDIRSFFQGMGSIPKQISRTINLMQRSMMKFDEKDCMQAMNEDIKQELQFHLQQQDEKSFERLYLRSRHLSMQLLAWNNKLSPYYHFRTVYQTQFDNICKTYARFDQDIKRYYGTLIEFRKTYQSLQHLSADDKAPIDADAFFVPLRKNRAELRSALKGILENMYTLVASAILSEGISESARIKRLKTIGFYIPRIHMERLSFADPNDLVLLSLLLFLVVPAMAVFCNSLKSGTLSTYSLSILVIWPAMAVWVGFAGVIPIAMIKKQLETSRSEIWLWLRENASKVNLPAYVMAGAVAFMVGAAGMILLMKLDPRYADQPLKDLTYLIPWALVSFAISIATGLNYDRTTSDISPMRPADIFITATFTALAAVVALFISEGDLDLAILAKGHVYLFVLPVAALLGGIIGAIIPSRYRRYKAQQLILKCQRVDLEQLIVECRSVMAERIRKERVTVNLHLAPGLPKIDVDRYLIEQAIIGLLSNAFEYTAPGSIIRIELGFTDDRKHIQIAVSDNGTGISQGRLLEIRESFEHHDTQWLYFISTEVPADLQQINFIAFRHGGALDLERNETGGTTARITLPINITETDAPTGRST